MTWCTSSVTISALGTAPVSPCALQYLHHSPLKEVVSAYFVDFLEKRDAMGQLGSALLLLFVV